MLTEDIKDLPQEHTSDPITGFIVLQGGRVLRRVVWLILIAVILANGSQFVSTGTVSTVAGPFLLVGLLTLWLLSRRQRQRAFRVFLWGMVLGGLLAAFQVSGFQTPGLFMVPIGVALAAWLLPRREVLWMTTISLISFALLALLAEYDWLPHIARSPTVWAITFGLITLLCASLGTTMTASIREQYGQTLHLSKELSALNQALESKVAERTRELEATLVRLKQSQDELIQSEKLASLGAMVAGITHELNTPIGNAVTVSTTLIANAEQLLTQMHAGRLRRTEFDATLSAIKDMADLIYRSVERSAMLVASFKQLAAEQIAERRQVIDLRQLVERAIASVRPTLRAGVWQIDNQVAANITCDTFADSLSQVLGHLIQNAVMHGFEGQGTGQITINATYQETSVAISVSDNGHGISPTLVARIFDPFFTTHLGKGGSGIGLTLCHRLVGRILAGTIQVHSQPGQGTCFTVCFPRQAPGAI